MLKQSKISYQTIKYIVKNLNKIIVNLNLSAISLNKVAHLYSS